MREIIRDYLYDIKVLCESDFAPEQWEEKELIEKNRKQMAKSLLAIVKTMMMSEDFKHGMDDWYELAEELNEVETKAIARFNIYKED